ncbi:MAG: hypothetical protein ACXVXY_13450 [Mycobacteriaceae bacterium]
MDYSSNGDWYISNKELVSAWLHDWWYGIDTAETYTTYYSGNSWVSWSPYYTRPFSACSSSTVSATDPKTGTSVSETEPQIAHNLVPILLSNGLGFGSAWEGWSSDTMGAEAVGVVHNPPGYSAAYAVHVYMHWS